MENGRHSMEKQKETTRNKGGWKSIKYIIGNESFEKLASVSLVINMTFYLRSNYNMNGIFLINVVTIWAGTSNISSLAGAYLSDAYIGKYFTLLLSSIASLLGMGMMTLTAGVPHFRPPKCSDQLNCVQPEKWQLAFLYAALGLLAFGSGGLRPCGIASEPISSIQPPSMAANSSKASSIGDKHQLDDRVRNPTACLLSSLVIFLIGRHTYVIKKPEGSVFSDIAKVIVASIRKRKIQDESKYSFYQERVGSKIPNVTRTQRFKYLDKAAMIVDPIRELNSNGVAKNSGGCAACNKSGPSSRFPPGWVSETAMITLSMWIFMYEGIYVPMLKRIFKREARLLTMAMRVRIGIIMSIVCMVTAAVIERKRRSSALKNRTYVAPMHIWWIIPQFMLSGLVEAFDNVAMMEFFTTRMPESMRTTAGAIFFVTLSISSYLNSLIVNIIHKLTGMNGGTPWLGGHDLNKNRLDYYYYIIAGFGVLNLIYFTFVGSKYTNPAKVIGVEEESKQDEDGGDGRQPSGEYHEL
ncbi:hypothetical protein OSB04_003219 [Centaurea solstitialis]|uniref:NPF family transporter n=1 Tax=Centaurea solstitialis TaxID=347529 RepID=A0AA38TUF0_9ASTR|nr:hypothetical protein OSB04_003219 [Centaurea solstitialis]